MSFSSLLIQTCTIEQLSLTTTGYEKTQVWTPIFNNVKCRHDSDNSPKITDESYRLNTTDDIFFFLPDQAITRGQRILLNGEYYDIIKVNKSYNSVGLHHLEVVARITDNK